MEQLSWTVAGTGVFQSGGVSESGTFCVLQSPRCQKVALSGHCPKPCEYPHQAYNYPQVLLSRKHPLVVFYITLQHRVLRKAACEFEDFEQSQGASYCSFQTDSGICSATPHCKLQLLCLHFTPKRDDVLTAKLKCIKYATSIFPCWQLQ